MAQEGAAYVCSGLRFSYRTPPKFGDGLLNPSRRTNYFVYNSTQNGRIYILLVEYSQCPRGPDLPYITSYFRYAVPSFGNSNLSSTAHLSL